MGATTWVAHTLLAYGRALRARGEGDDERASALLGEAAALAETVGMPTVLASARALTGGIERVRIPPDNLTGRELDIFRMVASGSSNRKIGQALFISQHIVANHVRSILRKTGTGNRTRRPPMPIDTAWSMAERCTTTSTPNLIERSPGGWTSRATIKKLLRKINAEERLRRLPAS